LDQPSLQTFRHLVLQHLPAATEQPEGSEEFVELDEENSAGRRGGQTAAGGFSWAADSSNRAGNSEDEEELGEEDSSSQATTKQRRRRACNAWSSTGDNECRVCEQKKGCKQKYGKDECQKYCWKYQGGWTCPGCSQEAEEKNVASAITDTWESKRGLEYCKKYQQTAKLTKVMSVESASVKAWKEATGNSNHDLHAFDVSKIAADFRWSDHIIIHRSGIHEATVGKQEFQLCASWTAVCLGTPPSHGQSCATVRKVLGCKYKSSRRASHDWSDCDKWHSKKRLAMSNLA